MGAGTKTDFVIYNEEFYGGAYERLTQNVNAFNASSAGALQLVAKDLKGDFEKESFFKAMAAGLVSRRDITSVAAATDQKLQQDEQIGVKINRKIGPVAQTLDAWRKVAKDPREMSFILGGMVADHKLQDMVNTAIAIVEAAVAGVAAVNVTKAATIQHSDLVDGMATFGDASSRIVAFVMHSKPYFDLVKQAIADKIFEVAGATIYQGTVATFNRPTIVIDAPALLEAGTPNTYPVLGLTPGAVTITESEEEEIVSEIVTGLENLVFRVQGEYAFNAKIKGFKWDVTNGGVNPADAALATSSNWDKIASSDKDLPGFRLSVQ